jgi:hypothetical protein
VVSAIGYMSIQARSVGGPRSSVRPGRTDLVTAAATEDRRLKTEDHPPTGLADSI